MDMDQAARSTYLELLQQRTAFFRATTRDVQAARSTLETPQLLLRRTANSRATPQEEIILDLMDMLGEMEAARSSSIPPQLLQRRTANSRATPR